MGSTSKKRSPTIAFSDEPPSTSSSPSRPTLRNSHSQKRLQRRRIERPTWVTSQDSSICLRDILHTTGISEILYPSPTKALPQKGCRVLCFLGSTTTHLTALQSVSHLLLQTFSTPIHAISLTPNPPTDSLLPQETHIIHDATRTLTLQLGLLHPLGGGRIALDAIVVLDGQGRRRMLLPVGWGVRACGVGQQQREMGHLVGGEGGGEVENVVMRLVKGVEWLCAEEGEREDEDVGEDVEMEI